MKFKAQLEEWRERVWRCGCVLVAPVGQRLPRACAEHAEERYEDRPFHQEVIR